MMKFPWSKKIRSYYTKHADFNAVVHIFTGIAIAWLISLIWHYAISVLAVGVVFLLTAFIMEGYAHRRG